MAIEIGTDYIFIDTLEEITFMEADSKNHYWIHTEFTGDMHHISQEEMEKLLSSNLIETKAESNVRLFEIYSNAIKIVRRKHKKLKGKPVIISTTIGDEFYGILEDVVFEDDTILLSEAVILLNGQEPIIAGYAELPLNFVDSFNPMSNLEKAIWDEYQASVDPADKEEPEDMSGFLDGLASNIDFDYGKKKKASKEKEKAKDRNDVKKLPKTYNPALVNSDLKPDELAKKLKIALAKEERPDAITILLSGAPGVGKTMSVAYIANKLKMPVHTHKVSDLVDKWVGSTEKAVAKAFKDASEAGAICHIDEVDSISSSRDESDKQHQVSAISAVLQSLDDFKGLAIFTTNSTDRMDTAILRRMLLEVEMNNLTDDQADKMAKIFFPKRRIKGLEHGRFAPADFAKVKDGFLFTDDKDINKTYILRKLKAAADTRNGVRTMDKHKSPMGFNLN